MVSRGEVLEGMAGSGGDRRERVMSQCDQHLQPLCYTHAQ